MPYLAHGWPRALHVGAAGSPVALCADGDRLVLVTTACIELWAAGRDRVRLAAEAAPDGDAHAAAFWCGGRRALAVLVSVVEREEGMWEAAGGRRGAGAPFFWRRLVHSNSILPPFPSFPPPFPPPAR